MANKRRDGEFYGDHTDLGDYYERIDLGENGDLIIFILLIVIALAILGSLGGGNPNDQ